ncbi:MAG: (d)CMP kinase [Candidatus Saelkia tenebricola]|nr:(d)CMP kinase [Candidatus Saelkia tenebricola]
MKSGLIVAIDGPAGSGKSTVAKLVAERLNLPYLDTGAMYRAVTLACIKKEIDFSDSDAIFGVVKDVDIDIKNQDNKFEIYLEGENVTGAIRAPQVNANISSVSEILEVRKVLVSKQKKIGQSGAVMEGRDIGTVVFPNADYKFFIDASFDTRVDRRYKEIVKKQIPITRVEVEQDLKKRDHSDTTRKYGPLIKTEDAIYIDTTGISIDEVVENIAVLVSSER